MSRDRHLFRSGKEWEGVAFCSCVDSAGGGCKGLLTSLFTPLGQYLVAGGLYHSGCLSPSKSRDMGCWQVGIPQLCHSIAPGQKTRGGEPWPGATAARKPADTGKVVHWHQVVAVLKSLKGLEWSSALSTRPFSSSRVNCCLFFGWSVNCRCLAVPHPVWLTILAGLGPPFRNHTTHKSGQ